jgi:hypothetical protein
LEGRVSELEHELASRPDINTLAYRSTGDRITPMSIAIGQTLPVIGFLGSFYDTYEEISCLSFYDLLLGYYPLV